jgi:multidrug resistance efflux pump
MKRAVIILGILLLGLMLFLFVFGNRSRLQALFPSELRSPGTSQVTPTIKPIPPVNSKEVIAACRGLPKKIVDLGFEIPGRVEFVFVSEGQNVTSGQVLASLGNRINYEAAVAGASYDLLQAQGSLEEIHSSAVLEAATAAKNLADQNVAVRDAENRIDELENDDADEIDMNQARAALALARSRQEKAKLKYDLVKNGPDPKQLALAQSRLENAQAQLAAAEESLENLSLHAPFSGTISRLDIFPGQIVSAGMPVLTLVDNSQMVVETTDLDQLKVILVKPYAPVEITFDALPGLPFNGMVESISQEGINDQGEIIYKVLVTLDVTDPRLLWNMTCVAKIKILE